MTKRVTVTIKAHANIALHKYWGKRDETLMLPTKNSFSLTLDALRTETSITLSSTHHDIITFDWQETTQKSPEKIINFLNKFRKLYNINQYFSINTKNLFPTAAGLASSSSGYAALALGLSKLCNLNLSKKELSQLARLGSGSASRSVYGGFVQWYKGEKDDGSDCFAEQLFPENHWPELSMIIVILDDQAKKISSRVGMQQTIKTGSHYQTWLQESERNLPLLVQAIREKDIVKLGTLVEQDWYGMYQSMLSTIPKIDYLNRTSHAVIAKVKKLRTQNISAYFTTDAGPNVKILCLKKDIHTITNEMQKVNGVMDCITSSIAGEPTIVYH